jgi:hypothetical protein
MQIPFLEQTKLSFENIPKQFEILQLFPYQFVLHVQIFELHVPCPLQTFGSTHFIPEHEHVLFEKITLVNA